MKIKSDFVTNSSSTGFIITNLTDEIKTIVDFVKENPQLIERFIKEYNWHDPKRYNQKELIRSAELESDSFTLLPGDNNVTFGDEQGTMIGLVFDYILRDGGKSKSFKWSFDQYYR